jgi:hypothetical protein
VVPGETRYRHARSNSRCSIGLQFTLLLAAGCVLHRPTSQVIHRLELYCLRLGLPRESLCRYYFTELRGKVWVYRLGPPTVERSASLRTFLLGVCRTASPRSIWPVCILAFTRYVSLNLVEIHSSPCTPVRRFTAGNQPGKLEMATKTQVPTSSE